MRTSDIVQAAAVCGHIVLTIRSSILCNLESSAEFPGLKQPRLYILKSAYIIIRLVEHLNNGK